jgi:transcription elongation factor/antiterminator RfaH
MNISPPNVCQKGLPSAADLHFDHPSWYVIYTNSRHEIQVEARLKKIGLEIFLPMINVMSRRRDRRRMIEVPLFPGYLFVHASLEGKTYYEIIRQAGVVRILGYKGVQMPVPAEVIESIQTILACSRPYYPWAHHKVGQQVRILDGPLAGTIGVLHKVRGKKRRLVVGVELFQRSVTVELDDETVERWN